MVRLFRNETQEWYHVYAAGEEIICTAEHSFYVDGKGFVPARNLKERDNLLLSDGSKAEIESLKTEHVEIPETTYNFEVKDFHTYYVSHSKVLVHNVCYDLNQKALIELIKENGKTTHLSMDEAITLVEWGDEYGINIRIDMGHLRGISISRNPHLHTGFNNWHIPIKV